MDQGSAQNNGDHIPDLALSESLLKSIALLQDCRKFMAVARLSLQTDTEISEALLTFMISRLDPILDNIYENIPDQSFVNVVMKKLQNPNYYEDDVIDFVEIYDEHGNVIASSIDESNDDVNQ